MRTFLPCIALLVMFVSTGMAQGKAAKAKGIAPPADYETKMKDYLKENVNDPSRLQFVKFSKPFNIRGWRFHNELYDTFIVQGYDAAAVHLKYRTTNPFGALQIEEKVFLFDGEKIGRVIDARDVRPPGYGKPDGDPFMDSLLQQFR